tara:strand:- start:160 stop:624 length:465 start_codon:yes stop_codon:yes gene_type:complete
MIAESLHNFNTKNICILSSIKNNLIIDGLFHKLLYSNNLYTSNGIYISIILNNTNNNNGRLTYDISDNLNILQKISQIEKYIFSNIINEDNKDKKIYYKISEQLNNGSIKITNYNKNTKNFILKISGIWENSNALGISFKLIAIDKILSFNSNI